MKERLIDLEQQASQKEVLLRQNNIQIEQQNNKLERYIIKAQELEQRENPKQAETQKMEIEEKLENSLETNLEIMKLRKVILEQMEFTHTSIQQC